MGNIGKPFTYSHDFLLSHFSFMKQKKKAFITHAVKNSLDQYLMGINNYLYILLLLMCPNCHMKDDVRTSIKRCFLCFSFCYTCNEMLYEIQIQQI